MLKKIVFVVFFVIALLLCLGYILLKYSKIPDPFPQNSQSAAWAEEGRYKVAALGFTLRDETRQTQEIHGVVQFLGLPYREFEATVWFPEGRQNEHHPLVVYSHAFMSERGDIHNILQNLSSRGYIVLAANYPLTSKSNGEAMLMADVVNQPADVSFLIDQITNPETEIGKSFSHSIDEAKIGVMGYSLGGLTSTLVAYHPEHLDHRIKAVVSLAGPSAMLGSAFYETNNIPFMMIAGTADEMTPFDDHALVILERIGNSVLVKIDGGSHLGFAGMAAFLRWSNNPDSVACFLMNKKMESLGLKRGKVEKAWYPLIGTTDQGVIYDDTSEACKEGGIETDAINPLRQQMLAKVATASFFESVFNSSPVEQKKAEEFLAHHLAKENSEVHVSGEYIGDCQSEDCL